MHERSLVRALIRQAEEFAAESGGGRVTEVAVSLGEFSGVDARLFALAFDDLKPGTPLGAARLKIEEVDLEGRCDRCGASFAIEGFRFVCPDCGGTAIEVVRGEELVLESLKIESTALQEVEP